MKEARVLDLDGLDGVIQRAEKIRSRSIGAIAIWITLIVLLVVMMLFLMHKWPNLPVSLPFKWQPQADNLSEASPNIASEISASAISPSPLAKPSVSEPSPADQAAPQADSSVTAAQTVGDDFVLPTEPTAAGNPVKPANDGPYLVYFKLKASKPVFLSEAEKGQLVDFAKRCTKGVRIIGHTCNLGSEWSNQRLGQARAGAVKKILIANGIGQQFIETLSEGMTHPMASNDSPSGQASNRRVELNCLEP